MKYFYFIAYLLISFRIFASDIISLRDNDNITITAYINDISKTFTMHIDEPANDAHDSSGPLTIYVPMLSKTAGGSDNNVYFSLYQSGNGGITTIFDHVNNTTTSNNYIFFPLKVTIGSTTMYPHIAVKNGTNYIVAKNSSVGYSSITDENLDFTVSPHELCVQAATDVCTNLTTTSTTGTTQEISAYIFLASTVKSLGSTDVTPDANGVYVKFKLSNRVYLSTDLKVTMSSLLPGDSRLLGNFSTNTTMDSNLFYKTRIFKHDSAPADSTNPVGSYSGVFDDQLLDNQTGEFTLSGLTNGNTYYISVALVDKYLFATTLSSSLSKSPMQIEELLKKQSCFLLTAGFGEENYIINYFRNFRDQILSKYYLGQVFIKYYYKYAPKFALSIYNNEAIRFCIRMMAYSLYFIFNYFVWLLAFMLIIFAIFRKNKSNIFKI